MSIPTLVFLDTSIFDGQQYNFSSIAFSTFVRECRSRGVKLILPDPTEREIQRHIRAKSSAAVKALKDAIRQAPFLSKWRPFAQRIGSEQEVQQVARGEWIAFMNQFSVVRVGYESLDMRQIMDWYDHAAAPFGKGGKQKEFPDAIAVALLADYAQKHSCYVAVVSGDLDFEAACKRFSSLLYFKTLQSLTELLISTDDTRVVSLQAAIQNDLSVLEEAVFGEAEQLDFYHPLGDGYYTLDSEHRQIRKLSIHDVSVVAIGSNEATVTFEANAVAEFRLNWEERGSDDYPEFYYGDFEEDVLVSGSAKVSFDETATKVIGVNFVALDQGEIELRREPGPT